MFSMQCRKTITAEDNKKQASQAFWQSSAPGVLSTLVTSVVLYSLTRATLMSPGKDETRVCGYIHSEFIH